MQVATNTKLARSVQPRRVHFAFEEKKQRERKWQERAVNLSGARTRWSHLSVDCRPGQIQMHTCIHQKILIQNTNKNTISKKPEAANGSNCRLLVNQSKRYLRTIYNHQQTTFPFIPANLTEEVITEKNCSKCRLWFWGRYFHSLTIVCTCWFLYLYLFQKVVQNADCDDAADMQIEPGHNVGRCEEARGEVVKEGF